MCIRDRNINKNNDEINRERIGKLMLELIEELEIHKLESQNTNYNPNLILLLRFLLART